MKHEDDWRQTLGPDPLPSARKWTWAILAIMLFFLTVFVLTPQ